MASVFLGINDRTFTYKWVAGRSEFQGTGFRNPMDFAFGPDNSIYVVNRSYESRADGTRINLFVLDEDGTEHYVTEFGGYGELDANTVILHLGGTVPSVDAGYRTVVVPPFRLLSLLSS